jgi:hypothetical protein
MVNPTTRQTFIYHALQIRAFCRFDYCLLRPDVPTDLIIPGGYIEWAKAFNQKADVPFRFSGYTLPRC